MDEEGLFAILYFDIGVRDTWLEIQDRISYRKLLAGRP
jgi:hypothetical protein